jgi:hypothetical protein
MYLGGLTMKIIQIVLGWKKVSLPVRGGIEVLGRGFDRLINHQRA